MGDLATFDRLVRELSNDDRKQLLARVRRTAPLTDDPLADAQATETPHVDLAEEYGRLSWLQRIVLGLKAMLSGLARDAALLELLRQRIGTSIQRSHPGLVDQRHEVLSAKAGAAMRELSVALLPLRDAFHDALNVRRDEFVAYLLASLQPHLHQRLLNDTDPLRLAQSASGAGGGASAASAASGLAAIRREMDSRFEDAIAGLPEADRRGLYVAVVTLHRLNDLIQHDLETLARRCDGTGARYADIRGRFLVLANKVLAAAQPPPEAAIQVLFLFHYGESGHGESGGGEAGHDDADGDGDGSAGGDAVDSATSTAAADEAATAAGPGGQQAAAAARLEADLRSTNAAFDALRQFNVRLPVAATARLVSGDLSWQPDEPVGGEDWYALTRNYWRRRMTARFEAFARQRNLEQIRGEACSALQIAELPTVAAYERIWHPLPGRHATTLGLLAALGGDQAPRLLRPLRILLTGGEFYRNDNRVSFERSLAELQATPRELATFGASLDEEGNEIADPRAHADQLARRLAELAARACTELTAILGGILDGKVGSQYDSITNRATIGGRENLRLLEDFSTTRGVLETIASHLRRALDLELERSV